MNIGEQLLHTLILSPTAIFRLRLKTWAWVVLYAVFAGAILSGVSWLLVTHQDHLREALVGYIFPESWAFAAEMLAERFLQAQTKAVLITALVSGTLVLISVLLFPLKEKVSESFECESLLTEEKIIEFPLWFQALEEIKLLILYVTAQMAIFWIGYGPSPARKILSTVLGFVFLFTTVTIDFISPLLQRHGVRYSQILKALLRFPIILFGFGACFALPAVVMGFYVAHHSELMFSQAVVMLFAANLASIVWACVGGTWIASKFLDTAKLTSRSLGTSRLVAWLMLLGAFCVGSFFFGSLAMAAHHKSQILKCNYQIVPGSFGVRLPQISSLLLGTPRAKIGFNVEIENPTSFDVKLEKNRLEIKHGETMVAIGRLAPLAVPAQQKRVQKMQLSVEIKAAALLKGRDLLKDLWTVTLYIEIAEAFDFPIYLRAK